MKTFPIKVSPPKDTTGIFNVDVIVDVNKVEEMADVVAFLQSPLPYDTFENEYMRKQFPNHRMSKTGGMEPIFGDGNRKNGVVGYKIQIRLTPSVG